MWMADERQVNQIHEGAIRTRLSELGRPDKTPKHRCCLDDGEMRYALFPLDRGWRLAGDIQHNPIHLIHLVGDSGTDPLQHLVR
jgi:hypothetical protein